MLMNSSAARSIPVHGAVTLPFENVYDVDAVLLPEESETSVTIPTIDPSTVDVQRSIPFNLSF
jgi:hypothetical protein